MCWPHLEVSEFSPLFFCVPFSSFLQIKTAFQQCKLPHSCGGLVSNSTFFCSRWTLPSSSYALAHPRLEDAPLGLPRNSSAISARTRIFASGFNSITPELFGSAESISCFHHQAGVGFGK